jgi:hypothetical protein
MTAARFSLLPFSPPGVPLAIQGEVSRAGDALHISYVLSGDLAGVIMPSPATSPSRRHHLWQTTCFELFLASEGGPGYWELNVSPGFDWNLYRFAAYREGMREEPTVAELPVTVEQSQDSLTLRVGLRMSTLVRGCGPLGVSAVLKHARGDLSYWALRHVGSQPDFHHRDGFLIAL